MNLDEAAALTGKNTEDEMVTEIAKLLDHFVITKAAEGSTIYTNSEKVSIAAYKTNKVDSTGAGDAYAGGYLFGLSNNLATKESGNLASFLAAQVVAKNGPRLSGDVKNLVNNRFNFNL